RDVGPLDVQRLEALVLLGTGPPRAIPARDALGVERGMPTGQIGVLTGLGQALRAVETQGLQQPVASAAAPAHHRQDRLPDQAPDQLDDLPALDPGARA